MKKTYSIAIEPTTITRQGLRNIDLFLSEMSTFQGVDVNDEKLEFTCDSDLESVIVEKLEKYSIVNLIGLS